MDTDQTQYILDLFHRLRGQRDQMIPDWLSRYYPSAGLYPPHILQNIPEGFSRVKPKDVKTRITTFTSKFTEFMFPVNRWNWDIKSTPIPNISADELSSILQALLSQGVDPSEISQEIILKHVKEYSDGQADKLDKLVKDQLIETELRLYAARAVKSAAIYNIGIIRGPEAVENISADWRVLGDGSIEVYEQVYYKPSYSFVPIWRMIFDFTASEYNAQRAIFEKVLYDANTVRDLTTLKGFKKENVLEYLEVSPEGNVTYDSFEGCITDFQYDTGLFEFFRGYVFVPSFTDQGRISTSKYEQLYEVYIFNDELVYMGDPVNAQRPSDMYHGFVYDPDSINLFGGDSLVEDLKMSDVALGMATRVCLDNLSQSAGPIHEVNEALMEPDSIPDGRIRSFQTIRRKGSGQESQYPALRLVQSQNHTSECMAVMGQIRATMDIEAMLPAWLSGSGFSPGSSEALRTTSNMSMLSSNAMTNFRSLVRSFDLFFRGILNQTISFNRLLNPHLNIRGDYDVMSTGIVSSLMREVLGPALDQLTNSLSDEERLYLDPKKTLLHKLEAREIPENVLRTDEEVAEIREQQSQLQSQLQQVELALKQAQVGKTDAEREKAIATALAAVANLGPQGERIRAQAQNQTAKTFEMLRSQDSNETNKTST